jgi:PhnB protein
MAMKLNPYANFAGTCEEAFRYYEEHLGGKRTFTMRWKEMPVENASQHIPPGMEEKILHASIDLGKSRLQGADVPGADRMRSAYLTLSVETDAEAERIYDALADGGQVLMKMNSTFFATRFGQVRDRFGVNWMVVRALPMPS